MSIYVKLANWSTIIAVVGRPLVPQQPVSYPQDNAEA